jgi:hypothetical protein
MTKLIIFILLTISANSFADIISTIKDRKTKNKLEIHCLDESCSRLEIIQIDSNGDSIEVLGSYDQQEYIERMNKLAKDDKLSFKKHFFLIIQGISKLPWSDEEFRFYYFLFSPFTIPLTLAAAAFDVAITPFMAVDFTVDALNGNIGKKATRAVNKKKNLTINNYRFEKLSEILRN